MGRRTTRWSPAVRVNQVVHRGSDRQLLRVPSGRAKRHRQMRFGRASLRQRIAQRLIGGAAMRRRPPPGRGRLDRHLLPTGGDAVPMRRHRDRPAGSSRLQASNALRLKQDGRWFEWSQVRGRGHRRVRSPPGSQPTGRRCSEGRGAGWTRRRPPGERPTPPGDRSRPATFVRFAQPVPYMQR